MRYQPMPDGADTVDQAFARTFAEDYLGAWNAHDLDRLLALIDEDVRWEDPFLPGGSARGRAAIRQWAEDLLRTFPDLTFTLVDEVYLAGDGRKVAAPWRITAGGSPMVGVDIFEFRGRRLARVRTIVGMTSAQVAKATTR
jgi:ketosteroid isomerase-like protein